MGRHDEQQPELQIDPRALGRASSIGLQSLVGLEAEGGGPDAEQHQRREPEQPGQPTAEDPADHGCAERAGRMPTTKASVIRSRTS